MCISQEKKEGTKEKNCFNKVKKCKKKEKFKEKWKRLNKTFTYILWGVEKKTFKNRTFKNGRVEKSEVGKNVKERKRKKERMKEKDRSKGTYDMAKRRGTRVQ